MDQARDRVLFCALQTFGVIKQVMNKNSDETKKEILNCARQKFLRAHKQVKILFIVRSIMTIYIVLVSERQLCASTPFLYFE